MLLKELLSEREIPKLKSREEMLQIMQEEVYGYLPAKPNKVSFVVTENIVNNFCAGKAVLNKVIAECTIGSKVFFFSFLRYLANGREETSIFYSYKLSRMCS